MAPGVSPAPSRLRQRTASSAAAIPLPPFRRSESGIRSTIYRRVAARPSNSSRDSLYPASPHWIARYDLQKE